MRLVLRPGLPEWRETEDRQIAPAKLNRPTQYNAPPPLVGGPGIGTAAAARAGYKTPLGGG